MFRIDWAQLRMVTAFALATTCSFTVLSGTLAMMPGALSPSSAIVARQA